MSNVAADKAPHYFVPEPSRHPFFAAMGLFFLFFGASQWMNDSVSGKYLFIGLYIIYSYIIYIYNMV